MGLWNDDTALLMVVCCSNDDKLSYIPCLSPSDMSKSQAKKKRGRVLEGGDNKKYYIDSSGPSPQVLVKV